MGFPVQTSLLQEAPGAFVPGITLRVHPMNSRPEQGIDDPGQCLAGIALPLVVLVYDVAQLLGLKVPVAAVNVSNHLPGVLQCNRIEFVGGKPVDKMLFAVFIGDSGIALKLVVLQLGQEFKQIIIVILPEGPQDQSLCLNRMHVHILPDDSP